MGAQEDLARLAAAQATATEIKRIKRKLARAIADGLDERVQRCKEKLAKLEGGDATPEATPASVKTPAPSQASTEAAGSSKTVASESSAQNTTSSSSQQWDAENAAEWEDGGEEDPSEAIEAWGPAGENESAGERDRGMALEGHKVFASRLPKWWGDDELAQTFSQFGEVNGAVVCREKAEEGAFVDDTKPPKSLRFGFVAFATAKSARGAIEAATVAVPRADGIKGKLQPVRIGEAVEKDRGVADGPRVCGLWKRGLCPYNDACKFEHTGEGACVPAPGEGRKRCWRFKKGSCSKGDDCPFSHDFVPAAKPAFVPRPDSEKPCLVYLKKGKCKKGDECPYRHDAAALEARRKRKAPQAQQNPTKGKKSRQNQGESKVSFE
eukprot:m.466696 g.466696  ORF g.466696 m.466696 type:complete len:381 (-) comp25459_c0_seq1:1885-3027(-)